MAQQDCNFQVDSQFLLDNDINTITDAINRSIHGMNRLLIASFFLEGYGVSGVPFLDIS